METENNQSLTHQVLSDRTARRQLAKRSHYWFFHIYFPHYIHYKTADFQREMFQITEDDSIKKAVIVAFRGSAKSTIMTLSYPIWAIIGKPQKKFIVIISQVQQQAKQHLINLKTELEHNELLKKELGPFEEGTDEWGSSSIYIPKFDAKILAASSEQSIRGIRHNQYRPDLIICDDVEDQNSVRTKEGRDKTYRWLTGEVIPAGDRKTKIIIIGNLLHEDSLLMRLQEGIAKGTISGVYKKYPLAEGEHSLWPDKFRDANEINKLRKEIGNEIAWQREFMLNIIPDEGQVIHRDWISYYDDPPITTQVRITATGVDLAISKNETADYTAMVSADVIGYGKNIKIYIHPNPINQRLDFPEQINMAKEVSRKRKTGARCKMFIEDVGYQRALIQQLSGEGLSVEAVQHHGQDKRSRLALTASLIKSGQILFPKNGVEELIDQIVHFGIEKHDDLADAFAILIIKIIEEYTRSTGVRIIGYLGPTNRIANATYY